MHKMNKILARKQIISIFIKTPRAYTHIDDASTSHSSPFQKESIENNPNLKWNLPFCRRLEQPVGDLFSTIEKIQLN